MITDGIDRLRGERPAPQVPPSRTPAVARPWPMTMLTISADADSASSISQQYGVIVQIPRFDGSRQSFQ